MLESYKCASDLCSAMTRDREAFSSFFEVGKLCGFQTIHTSETFFFKPHRSNGRVLPIFER